MSLRDAALDHAAMLEQWTLCSVEDVPDERFAAQPACADHAMPNHPAWILGHLVFAMDNLARHLGGDVSREKDAWGERFGGGTTPVEDASAYPAKAELIDAFRDAAATLRSTLQSVDEATFDEAIEDERIRAIFPTNGRFTLHVLLCEVAFHTGQLSAWRRAQGLPSVFDDQERVRRLLTATA